MTLIKNNNSIIKSNGYHYITVTGYVLTHAVIVAGQMARRAGLGTCDVIATDSYKDKILKHTFKVKELS